MVTVGDGVDYSNKSYFDRVSFALQPFVNEDHLFQKFFLPRHYAILIPSVLLVLLITVTGTFIGAVMLKSKKKKA